MKLQGPAVLVVVAANATSTRFPSVCFIIPHNDRAKSAFGTIADSDVIIFTLFGSRDLLITSYCTVLEQGCATEFCQIGEQL